MQEHGRLAAEQRDKRVAGHGHLREAGEVAGARGAVEKLLLLDVEHLEAAAVGGERVQRGAERAHHVEANAIRVDREEVQIAADPAFGEKWSILALPWTPFVHA